MYSLRKGAPGGAKSATACIMSLRVAGAGAAEIILADFNLAVSTPTAKPPNLNPHQIFRLYGIVNDQYYLLKISQFFDEILFHAWVATYP